MQIPAEVLSEKNYTGSRLIEITDDKVIALKAELNALQQEANPFLTEMDEIAPKMDPIFQKIQELEAEKNKLREELAPIRAPYDELLKKVEAIDSKAQLIKAKIQPIVNKIVEDQLGEFEKALHLKDENGKLYVEVIDEIEEKIKTIRQDKLKK